MRKIYLVIVTVKHEQYAKPSSTVLSCDSEYMLASLSLEYHKHRYTRDAILHTIEIVEVDVKDILTLDPATK